MDIHVQADETTTVLCGLMSSHGSDKGGPEIFPSRFGEYWGPRHVYTKYYHALFNPIKDQALNVFELGIGSTSSAFQYSMQNGVPGASLRAWRDFFVNSQIFGADIDTSTLFKEERINTFFVDQGNPKSIRDMWNTSEMPEEFDIIIDDGCHDVYYNVTFFENSFHKLKSGGIYIIEDITQINDAWKEYVRSWTSRFPIKASSYFTLKNDHYPDDVLLVFQKA